VSAKKQIQDLSKEFLPKIIDIRRNLHSNPELSFQEFETSKYIKSILECEAQLHLWKYFVLWFFVFYSFLLLSSNKNAFFISETVLYISGSFLNII